MSLNGNQYSPAPGILAPLAAAFALASVPLKAQTPAAPPVWWKTTGAVDSSKTPNDQAVAAVGQAMFMARKARENMAAVYGAVYLNGQYGCGEGIERIFRAHQRALNADATGTVNHRGLKIGQLKYISAPFWKRLQELGAPGIPAAPASPYPWDRPLPGGQTPPAPQPQALATLGQMKMAFSFLMENAGGNYQNRLTLEPALAEPQTAHAYVHQKFASGQSGGKYATSAVWYVDGVEVSGAELESGSQTSAYGQVGYGVNGVAALEGRFFRLPAVPDRGTGPASLSLSFPMPGAGGSVPDEDHSGHLYIQYRWRAFPDVVEEELYDPEANWRKAAGALVFLEESGAQRYPKGVIGWQRSSAAAGSGGFEVGGFDLAVPVWGVKWAGHTPAALADFPSDAVFNLRSRAGLAAGFPAAGVSGPGWRTTTVRIQLGVEGPDAMDIWLDGRPLGRSYAGYVDSSGEPSIPSTAFANPVFLKDRLSLQWNGLRNAPFDLGSIYIGWKNPLFQFNFRGDSAPDDGDPDHDGIPVGGCWPQYSLGAKPGWAPWIWTGQGGYPGMFNEEWEMDGDGTAQIFDRGFRMEEEGIRGKDWRQQWYPGRFREFDKKDISRFLQSMARPEPTLPMPYVVTPAGPQDGSDAIRPNPAFDSFGTVWGWEERIDRDRDGLPDNWEQFYGVMADNGQSDSDGDGISNADEYRHNLDPSGGAPASADVDQDGLSNDWELQHGYNPFDGVNQSAEDPDRDGLTNAQEAGLGTDPLAAADPGPASPGAPSGPRAGAAPGRYGAWVAGGSTPPPPLTAGSGLNRWIPGAAEDDPDKDDDGVPDDQDAVPYDPSLAFARVPESQYIVIPLTGADGVEEKGVPVAINNLGHILLAPEPPQGGWAAWPGSAGTGSLRAPKLWQRPGQAALPVPLPGTPGVAGVSAVPLPELAQEHYTAMWDHADARNRDTLDLDLAEDADIVLAHALLKYTGEGTVPAPVGQVIDRVPDLNGRHAFIWNAAASTGACLPWEPPVSLGRSSVERFLEGRSDHQETIADRLLFDGKAAGSGLRVRQRLLNASENKESDEWFYDFSWRNLGFAPELFLEVAGGTRSYLNQPPGGPAAEPENFQLDLHGIKGSRTVFHSWKRGAILEEGSDGTDRPFWETSSAQLSGEQGLALSRRGGWQRSRDRFYTPYVWTAQPEKFRLRKYQGGNPTALNDFPEFYDRPWPIAETGEGEPPLYPPVTTGPLIIGPPGCYWARSAATALQTGAGDGEFIPGWLYSHPGTGSTPDGSGSAGRVPFEISETAKINNQGIIICEDRLWRNGAGHNIADLVSSGPDYSDFELRDINDSGVIAATVLSASRNDRIPVMLVPVEIVSYFNRDGKIEMTDSGKITPSEPCRFWVNDDRDSDALSDDDEDADLEVAQNQDSSDERLDSYRDLIDWFPVFLDIKSALEALPPATHDYLVSHEDEAVNFIPCSFLRANTEDPAIRTGAYLTHPTAVLPLVQRSQDDGPPPARPAGNGFAVINWPNHATIAGVKLSPEWLAGILPDKNKAVMLIEGRKATNRALKLNIVRKSDGAKVTVELPLSMSSVKDMYRWGNLRAAAGENISDPENLNEPANWPDRLCSDKSFIFVHGYSVSQKQARGWAGEIFKRMFFAGSKAKFFAMTWRGNQGQVSPSIPLFGGTTSDYWVNVYNAFLTSPALAAKVNAIGGGGKYLAAHSLGNMVASSAMVDHGMAVNRYFMIDAAVPGEAYDVSARSPDDQGNKMIQTDWRAPSGIPSNAFAANYGDLFPDTADHRHMLTWKGRFAGIQNVYQLYSSGEDVLEPNRNGAEPTLVGDVIFEGVKAWVGGEMKKGTFTKAFGQLTSGDLDQWGSGWKSRRGGWSFNRSAWPSPSMPATTAQKIATPLFKPFNEAEGGQSVHGPQGSALLANAKTAGTPGYRYLAALLAQDIPALSWPAGSVRNPAFWQGSMDLQELTANGWDPQRPRFKENDLAGRVGQGRWFHSDIKNVSYFYNYLAFEKITAIGNLKN